MAGKVLHVSDEAHKKATEFCSIRKIQRKTWVGDLVEFAVEAKITEPGRYKLSSKNSKKIERLEKEIEDLKLLLQSERNRKRLVVETVEKREVRPLYKEEEDLSIYTQPPFWEKQKWEEKS